MMTIYHGPYVNKCPRMKGMETLNMTFISSRAGYAVVLGTASDVKVHLLVEELGGHFRLQVGVDLIQVFSPALRLPLPCLVFM